MQVVVVEVLNDAEGPKAVTRHLEVDGACVFRELLGNCPVFVMTISALYATIGIGIVHGFVAWRLALRLVGPVARASQGRHATSLRVTGSVTYVVALVFVLVIAFMLLEVFGRIIAAAPTKESRGYLFIGSMAGLLLSGALAKAENALVRRSAGHRTRVGRDGH